LAREFWGHAMMRQNVAEWICAAEVNGCSHKTESSNVLYSA
jgi:hypothetical protein